MWHINNPILTPKLVRIVSIVDKPLSTQINWCIFTQLCQCHLELQKAREPFSLCIDCFSLSRILYYFAKDTSIFHLKSGNSNRPSYFTHPNHHDRPITDGQLLRWKDFDMFCANLKSFQISLFSNSFVHFRNPHCVDK